MQHDFYSGIEYIVIGSAENSGSSIVLHVHIIYPE